MSSVKISVHFWLKKINSREKIKAKKNSGEKTGK
jgi:hypothetical protein